MLGEALNTATIKQEARNLGFDMVGVCAIQAPPHLAEYEAWLRKGHHGEMDYLARQLDLKRDPEKLLPGARSIIAVGLNYRQPNPPQAGRPRIAAYALGRDYHKVIRSKLNRLAARLANENPGARFRPCIDSAPIFERDYAQLAGLGWFGKNTCLIDSKRGSWFFIGLLLTTLELQTDAPAIGGCGACRNCIDACPTGAIIHEDGRWQVNANRCVSYLTIEHKGEIDGELAEKMGDWTFGCDVCQDVCPFNRPRLSQPLRATDTTELDFLDGRRKWPSLEQLAQIDETEWDELTRGSAVRRTGVDGLRRNAQINLQNGPKLSPLRLDLLGGEGNEIDL